jgi:hypothetical protein
LVAAALRSPFLSLDGLRPDKLIESLDRSAARNPVREIALFRQAGQFQHSDPRRVIGE